MMDRSRKMVWGVLALSWAVVACGGSDDDGDENPSEGMNDTAGENEEQLDLDPQRPPASRAELEVWLQAFEEMDWENEWVCETSATDKRQDGGDPSIHVHGATNRVCNNVLLAGATLSGAEQLPVGAAAIKYVAAGVYVEVKVDAESDSGRGWFWYAPGGAVAARGASECVGCHAAAGSDAAHPGLGDFVYFQVDG